MAKDFTSRPTYKYALEAVKKDLYNKVVYVGTVRNLDFYYGLMIGGGRWADCYVVTNTPPYKARLAKLKEILLLDSVNP